jgi:dienelactone hydrolase
VPTTVDGTRLIRPTGARSIASLLSVGLLFAGCSNDEPTLPPDGSREIEIDSEGAKLAATVMGEGTTAVVISHGANGRRDDFYDILRSFADAGSLAVAYDGRPAHRDNDLRAAVGWARTEGATRIVLLGGSLGACLSVVHAAELDADVVIGLSTAPQCDGDAVAAAAADSFAEITAQFVVAEGDGGFVPTAEALAAATTTELIVAEGDAHGSGVTNEHPEIIAELVTIASESPSQ